MREGGGIVFGIICTKVWDLDLTLNNLTQRILISQSERRQYRVGCAYGQGEARDLGPPSRPKTRGQRPKERWAINMTEDDDATAHTSIR
jgi:hypothetical protein